jgi:hypothetical protein
LPKQRQIKILETANLVTLSRTGVEFDYRGEMIDAHAPEMPTHLAKQLTIGARPSSTFRCIAVIAHLSGDLVALLAKVENIRCVLTER